MPLLPTFTGRLAVVVLPTVLAGCVTFYPPPETHRASASTSTRAATAVASDTANPAAAPSAAPPNFANLGRGACLQALREAGVDFEVVTEEPASGIDLPVRLRGPVAGIFFETVGTNQVHSLLDCRLALALTHWAPALHDAGVQRIEHFSMFRPGARVASTGKVSGHARGLALDAARFHFTDGMIVNVLDDWQDRERGGEPCPPRGHESEPSRRLRAALCRAVDASLFQVVLTPHYDRAHANHVHLEIKPNVDWTFVR